MPQRLSEGVVRLGSSLVNWYLVADGGSVVVVDAGLPRQRPQLEEGLRLLGRAPSDVAAVLLTHGHSDHIGAAESIRTDLGVPVHVHRADEELTTTRKQGKREASLVPYLRYAQTWKLLAAFAAAGVPPKVGEVRTFDEGELDLPGRPRAMLTPGHTIGHCAFHFASHGVLVLGDLLCTFNPLTGKRGPQLMPSAFNVSSATILDSLTKVQDSDAALLVVGHGEPWREGAAAAVDRARAVGST